VRKLIQRMPMLLFVGFNEGHKTSIFGFRSLIFGLLRKDIK
jgi:hypothetical protein